MKIDHLKVCTPVEMDEYSLGANAFCVVCNTVSVLSYKASLKRLVQAFCTNKITTLHYQQWLLSIKIILDPIIEH